MFSELNFGLLVGILFIVFGSWPVNRSYGELFLADGFILSANRISESAELTFRTIISLFARSRSFMLRISLCVFPLPLWSLMGHSPCLMYFFSQNSSKRLLLKIVAV